MDHAGRRRKLLDELAELEADAFLVTRLPNVRYLTGFSGSNGQLLVSEREAVLFTDGRYGAQAAREAADVDREVYSGGFVQPVAAVAERLAIRRVAFESSGVTHQTYAQLVETGLDLVPSEGKVERLRWVKEPAELAALEAAQAIADEAMARVTAELVEGVSEREVGLELEVAMRASGAEGIAFDTIVAFGEDAAEPHHAPTERQLRRGDVVKVDFGCVVDGYHSDMTRTVAFGEPSERLREVYEVVRAAHEAGVAAVRAGVTAGDADRAARAVIEDAGFGPRYVHPLGHGVGLEIHEGPALRVGGQDVVPEGAVVTVEPGIYVDGLGGVRIEDMVAVERDGARVIPSTTKDLVVL